MPEGSLRGEFVPRKRRGVRLFEGGLLHANPTGEGTLQLQISEGAVGDGICDAAHPGCFILVNKRELDRSQGLALPRHHFR